AVTVLKHGRVLAEGPYTEIRRDPRVVAAYLGDADAER
ncbi:MAG TPA: ABC transporter ATP-binding protein, partial [Phytomonospora sp.]